MTAVIATTLIVLAVAAVALVWGALAGWVGPHEEPAHHDVADVFDLADRDGGR